MPELDTDHKARLLAVPIEQVAHLIQEIRLEEVQAIGEANEAHKRWSELSRERETITATVTFLKKRLQDEL